ncbi:hypothetical protein TWF173_009708 [Orbilia oligospora]|nr:hypothetical protein TWF173_009708 [Orbilia oligospora]
MMVFGADMLTVTLLATLAFVCVHARDPLQNQVSGLSSAAGSSNAPPPGFSETLSIYGPPEPKQTPPKPLATYFELLLQLSTTDEWEKFNVSTTDYTTCHTLHPDVKAKKSIFRAAFSSTGSRDAQAGIKNMAFHFPDNTVPPDISIKVFRNAPPVAKSGRVASASVNPQGACYRAAESREPRVINIKEWVDMNEDERLEWLKPSWLVRSYYRLRATDPFLVMPPPSIKERASLGSQQGNPQTGRTTRDQPQKEIDRRRRRDESFEVARELGFEFR